LSRDRRYSSKKALAFLKNRFVQRDFYLVNNEALINTGEKELRLV